MQPPIICEIDDYPVHRNAILRFIDDMKHINDAFKVTLFAIPELMTPPDWAELDRRSAWVRPAIHGYSHARGELREGPVEYHYGRLRAILEDPRWLPAVKGPHYGVGDNLARACEELGLTVCLRTHDDLPPAPYICPIWAKYDPGHGYDYLLAHARNSPALNKHSVYMDWAEGVATHADFRYSTDGGTPRGLALYLCAGGHRLPGHLRLDAHPRYPDTLEWSLGEPLPFRKASAGRILIQHGIMYARPEDYPGIIGECARVLMPGGRLVVKEDDPLKHRFRGRRSECSREQMEAFMAAAGLRILPGDSLAHAAMLPGSINRMRKLRSGHHWCLVAERPLP